MIPQTSIITGMEEKTRGPNISWFVTVKFNLKPIGALRKYCHRWDYQWLEIVKPATSERNLWKKTSGRLLGPTMNLDSA